MELQEYNSLRAEILKLVELQSQLVTLSVVAFGTLMSVGVQFRNPIVVEVYPLLALILGIMWLSHAHSIYRCGSYIANRIEPVLKPELFGWERYLRQEQPPSSFATVSYWGLRSIFAGTALIAVLFAPFLAHRDARSWIFYGVSVVVSGAIVAIFLKWPESIDPVPPLSSKS